MELFENFKKVKVGTPLAESLRPKTLAEFLETSSIDLKHLPLKEWLAKNFLPNLIFSGPPGTGKTSLALLIGKEFNCEFKKINAVESGAKELKSIGDEAKQIRIIQDKRTVLFVDEIHRFNKSQQDILLPFTESGDLILIGATTENPYYELNRALLSRARVIKFSKVSPQTLKKIYVKACDFLKIDPNHFLKQECLDYVINYVSGDVRQFYNAIEIIFYSLDVEQSISKEQIAEVLGFKNISYDKNSDEHYNHISAFIKSIRGSDANAALLYFVKMMSAGEDPVFIARRLVILASEDIGNADPRALQIAVSGLQAVELVGLPEAEISLAQVITYLCSCPKSNRSYHALNKAKKIIEANPNFSIPEYLKSNIAPSEKANYKYPHDFPRGWVDQKYSPLEIKLIEDLYSPTDRGFEKNINDYLKWLKQ